MIDTCSPCVSTYMNNIITIKCSIQYTYPRSVVFLGYFHPKITAVLLAYSFDCDGIFVALIGALVVFLRHNYLLGWHGMPCSEWSFSRSLWKKVR